MKSRKIIVEGARTPIGPERKKPDVILAELCRIEGRSLESAQITLRGNIILNVVVDSINKKTGTVMVRLNDLTIPSQKLTALGYRVQIEKIKDVLKGEVTDLLIFVPLNEIIDIKIT